MAQSRFRIKEYGSISVYDNSNTWNNVPFFSIGDIKHSVNNSDHNGWLICDGRSFNSTDYPDLYMVISNSFGGGEGTFNIPDCRSRVIGVIGQGNDLSSREMGETDGEETHTMSISELVSHTHTGTSNNAGGHTHSSNSNAPGAGTYGLAHTSRAGDSTTTTGTDATNSGSELDLTSPLAALSINAVSDHSHSFTTNTTGSTTPFNVLQPTLFIGNVFIYAHHIRNGTNNVSPPQE